MLCNLGVPLSEKECKTVTTKLVVKIHGGCNWLFLDYLLYSNFTKTYDDVNAL
jgi:hypothetical protein